MTIRIPFGSTYPDYNGGVEFSSNRGLLFRGLQQESENGLVTYPFTIRNQLVTTLATAEAALANREALFDLQQEFLDLLAKRSIEGLCSG